MYGQFRIPIDRVQPDGFVQFQLRGNRAGIALLIHPFHGENLVVGEPAYFLHLLAQSFERDVLVDVRYQHLAVVGDLGPDFGGTVVH